MSQKILIIDEDDDFIFVMTKILTKKNRTIYVAHTLEEGNLLLQEKEPDLVFLNNLPGDQGWGKAEYILNNFHYIVINSINTSTESKPFNTSFRILEKQLILEEQEF